jgi:hypothetical protein
VGGRRGWLRVGAARVKVWWWDEGREAASTVDVVDDVFKLRSIAK